jgi:5-methylcytosine-specific restriction endonuclease McrA
MYKPRPMKIANCLQCEKKFKGVGQKIFCSINCGSTYKRRKKNVQPAKRIKEAICKECKKEFKPRKSENCIFCSRECSLTYQKRNGNRKGKKLISFDVYSDKRKKLIKQNGNFERINKLKVFERDNWKCHICNCKTPKEKKGTFDDNAPEMDHIVPLAAGGSHNYANVACSCRKCNGKKGKKPLGQLLFNL